MRGSDPPTPRARTTSGTATGFTAAQPGRAPGPSGPRSGAAGGLTPFPTVESGATPTAQGDGGYRPPPLTQRTPHDPEALARALLEAGE